MVDTSLLEELLSQLQEMDQTVQQVQNSQTEIAKLLISRSAGESLPMAANGAHRSTLASSARRT
jgi:hypothetical protein